MSFSTFVRNRNSERVIALFSAIAVLMSLMAIYAPAALAHHPEITASQGCVDGDVVVNYTSTSWLTTGASGSGHSDIRIQARASGGSWVEVDNGAYTSGNGYSFNGSFDGSALAGQGFWNTTVEVRAFANGAWDNGQGGGEYSSIAQVTVTQDCFNPSCPSGYLEYKVEPVGSGTFGPNDEFTIAVHSSGGNETFDWTSTVPVFQVIAKGGPGANTYAYDGAFAGNGLHAPNNPNNGKYYGLSHISFCYEEAQDEPVEVEVDGGVCLVDAQGLPTGSASVTIDPNSGATVNIYSDAAMTELVDTLTSSGTVDGLDPGTYYWTATAESGYELTGSSQGQFTVDDCEASVAISPNVCAVDQQGQPVGGVDVTIDPDSGATVEIYSDAAMSDLVATVTSSDTIDLAPGTYYWAADAEAGFDLTGDTEGQFTIDPCDVTVSVSGVCLVQNGDGVGQIDVSISTSGAASVEITDSASAVVAVLSQSGTVNVPAGADYTWDATAATGFAISGNASGGLQIEDCSPPQPPPENGEIVVEKVVEGTGSPDFEFTFVTEGFDLADNTLADGESSSSGDLLPGTGYSVSEQLPDGWTQVSATCDDGSDPSNIDLGVGEVVTCTFVNAIEGGDSVLAAIVVTVEGSCEVDGDEGIGLVDITVSVADGATVVVRDSDGDVVGTVASEGTIEVPEGATYTWEATPAEGFEFPPGANSSGTITIESCSDPETLPFTGIDTHQLGMFAIILLGAGLTTVFLAPRKREE